MDGMAWSATSRRGEDVPAAVVKSARVMKRRSRIFSRSWKRRKPLSRAGETVKAQGKIVLATVKGDVHDIARYRRRGARCNNYEVIDMG